MVILILYQSDCWHAISVLLVNKVDLFSGIGKTFFHSSSLSVLDGEAHSADNPFHISDDEDDFSPGILTKEYRD